MKHIRIRKKSDRLIESLKASGKYIELPPEVVAPTKKSNNTHFELEVGKVVARPGYKELFEKVVRGQERGLYPEDHEMFARALRRYEATEEMIAELRREQWND